MKRLLALLVGGLGLRALLRRRPQAAPVGDSPAEELRAKLAATKAEPEPQPGPDPEHAVDARRADVHERARKAIDDLKE